jgi:hypothetical protein
MKKYFEGELPLDLSVSMWVELKHHKHIAGLCHLLKKFLFFAHL